MTVIVWFRRDLRLRDHSAVYAALQSGQPIIPLFIFDPVLLRNAGVPRIKFMLKALLSLDAELCSMGRRLLIRHGNPQTVMPRLVEESGAQQLFFNLDYTPYARKRDEAVKQAVTIPVHTFHDRLLVPPDKIFTTTGGIYTVYTPFRNKWRELPKPEAPLRYSFEASQFHVLEGFDTPSIPTLKELGFSETIVVPPAGEGEAIKRLDAFMDEKVYDYQETRNRLGNPNDEPITGTSFLSPYIRFGLISPRQIRAAAIDAYRTKPDSSIEVWMSEIIWHEFYTYILYHYPHVLKQNFRPKFDHLQWRDAPDDLEKWREGRTGFPVIDAAIRQLRAIGWMHNRARMIVGSFLCKHLLIHWSHGERFFNEWLLDGDPAQNNGGWQWVAGTGTDAQPFFRIFNPVSQSQKFDPDGRFIRQWVIELHDVPDEDIHEPWLMPTKPRDYPAPMVNLEIARKRALQTFNEIKSP